MKSRINIFTGAIFSLYFFIAFSVASASDTARIIIRTSPSNAAVKIDGRPVSKRTPVAVRVSAGTHRVSASLSGHGTAYRSLSVYPGENYLYLDLNNNRSRKNTAKQTYTKPRVEKKTSTKLPARPTASKKVAEKKRLEKPAVVESPKVPVTIEYTSPPVTSESAPDFFQFKVKSCADSWPDSPEQQMFKQAQSLPKLPEEINILVLGLDRRDRRGIFATGREIPPERLERIRARSDTIMVARLDLADKSVKVVSVPRDTRIYLSRRRGYGKINEAYFIGRISFAKKKIGSFLDVPIHRYAVLDYRSMKMLIKIYHSLGFSFKGYDDKELFWYLRKRSFGRGDLKRIERQQSFIGKAIDDYLSFFRNISSKKGFWGRAEQTILDISLKQALEFAETDLTADEMEYLTYIFKDYKADDITFATVPGRVGGKRFGEDDEKYVSYFFPSRRHTFDQVIESAERKRIAKRQ